MEAMFTEGHVPLDAIMRPVHRAGEIWYVLNRERHRADRMNNPLSLVIFGTAGSNDARLLTRILATRTRLSDEIGQLCDHTLCVVLPETGALGAEAMAGRIASLANESGVEIEYDVYSYPDEQSGHELHDQAGANGERRRRQVRRVSAADTADVAIPGPRPAARSLEPLLILPHPTWKRLLDITGSMGLLLVCAPVLLGAMALVKMTSRGPAIFRQQRAGHGGKAFTMYKLRTMVVDAEQRKAALRVLNQQDGPAFKIRRDPRITRFGRILRSTSIDELPQLWNVLKGDMSLVGPRPLPVSESDGCEPWQRQRLRVIPGLTCIWQVRGRSRVTFNEWMRMDVQYIRRRSLLQDLKLLLQTVPAVAGGNGAH